MIYNFWFVWWLVSKTDLVKKCHKLLVFHLKTWVAHLSNVHIKYSSWRTVISSRGSTKYFGLLSRAGELQSHFSPIHTSHRPTVTMSTMTNMNVSHNNEYEPCPQWQTWTHVCHTTSHVFKVPIYFHLCYILTCYCFQYSAARRVLGFLRYKEHTTRSIYSTMLKSFSVNISIYCLMLPSSTWKSET